MARKRRVWRVLHVELQTVEDVLDREEDAGRIPREATRDLRRQLDRTLDLSAAACAQLDEADRAFEWPPAAA